MSISLTSRQQLLFDRLLTLGRWASERSLPTDALEILGFGSFFRGKPHPKDVDLLIRHTNTHSPEFARFLRLLDTVTSDVTYQEEFPTPQAALLHVLDQEAANMLPGFEDCETQERLLLGRWLEGFSWNMVLPQTHLGQLAMDCPEHFTKKFIKRHLPNVNVAFFLGPAQAWSELGLRSGFVVPIWSKGEPDMRANLEQSLSQERISECTLKELANFDRQFFLLNAHVNMFKTLFDCLLDSPRQAPAASDLRKWFDSWLDEHHGHVISKEGFRRIQHGGWLLTEGEVAAEIGTPYLPTSYAGVPFPELSELCERRRGDIKHLWEVVDVYRTVIHVLIAYSSGSANTDLPAERFIVQTLLERENERRRKKIRPILAEIGLILGD